MIHDQRDMHHNAVGQAFLIQIEILAVQRGRGQLALGRAADMEERTRRAVAR